MFVIVVFFFAELIPVTIAEKGLAVAARKEPSPVVMVETTCVTDFEVVPCLQPAANHRGASARDSSRYEPCQNLEKHAAVMQGRLSNLKCARDATERTSCKLPSNALDHIAPIP
jgi:hypothetical protein